MYAFAVDNSGIDEEKEDEKQEPNFKENLKLANKILLIAGILGLIIFWYTMWHYYIIQPYLIINIPVLAYFLIAVFFWETSASIVINAINDWINKT